MAARTRRSVRRPAKQPKPLTRKQQWLLAAYATASADARSLVDLSLMINRPSWPPAPGWWREGEGRYAMITNRRNEAADRADVALMKRRDAERAAGLWGGV